MYEYKVSITKVVDGDTVDVDIDLGFGMTYKKQRVRLMGIDTPESRTRDLVEKLFGKASKKHLKEILSNAGFFCKDSIEEMIANNELVNNEYYVCPAYNYMIRKNLENLLFIF